MRRLRVSAVTALVGSLACVGFVHGCAQSQGEQVVFGPDGGPDTSRPDVTTSRHDAGHDAAHDAVRDTGVDSTFGFDAYVPPNKDSGGHDTGHDVAVGSVDTGLLPPRDAGPDSGHDAGFLVLFGPPGSPCAKAGDLQAQTCGICGTQKSTCIVRPDGGIPFDAGSVDAGQPPDAGHEAGPAKDAGPPLVWGEFSTCTGQIDGGCTPGTMTTMSCGLCGSQMVVCEPDCEYAATNCTGQVDGGCVPGSSVFDILSACEADGGVPHDGGVSDAHHDAAEDAGHDAGHDAGTADAGAHDGAADVAHHDAGHDAAPVASPVIAGNDKVCSKTCEWTTSPTCELPPTTLTIASQTTGKVTTIVNFSATEETGRVNLTDVFDPDAGEVDAGGCLTSVEAEETPYGFVTVKNSSATQAATISAWTWRVPGAIAVTTALTAYATTPTTGAEYDSCLVNVLDSCDDMSDPTSCLGNYGGLMIGDGNQLTIPAGGSIVVFVQDQSNSAHHIGPVEVTIRTESFM